MKKETEFERCERLSRTFLKMPKTLIGFNRFLKKDDDQEYARAKRIAMGAYFGRFMDSDLALYKWIRLDDGIKLRCLQRAVNKINDKKGETK